MSSSESTIRPPRRRSRALPRRVPLAVLGGLVLSACTADYATQGAAPVLLVMQNINNALPMDSDVRISNGGVCPDGVALTVSVHGKNPNVTLGEVGNVYLERYEVQYFRSDGRGTEGVDVPYRISGNMSTRVVVGGTVTTTIEVVRRQAKVEPPLSSLAGTGGPFVLTMFAEITVHGRTLAGQVTNPATGRVQIDFADFGDQRTACPPIT